MVSTKTLVGYIIAGGLGLYAISKFTNPDKTPIIQSGKTDRTEIIQGEKTLRTEARQDTYKYFADTARDVFKGSGKSGSTKTSSRKVIVSQPKPIKIKDNDPPFIRDTANYTPASGGSAFASSPKVNIYKPSVVNTGSNSKVKSLKSNIRTAFKSSLTGGVGAAVSLFKKLRR